LLNNNSTIQNSSESFKKLLNVIVTLRGPEGCPWDKEQTLNSLIPHIFEETFECIDAIDADDIENVKEELGDLYLLIVMLSYIFEQTSDYKISDVIDTITQKLIRRHPHVFSDTKADSVDDVLNLWQDIKVNEEGRKKKDQLLDNISLSLPPLERAYKIQKRVAKVGFDWTNSLDVLNKIKEEINELEGEIKSKNLKLAENEMGDFLFSVINLSRFLEIDPGLALHKTNQKFAKRFAYIENELKHKNKNFHDSSLEEMDKIWEKAKYFD
jgi:tetrapyrrole methylase family protein / MazG family protein